MDLLIQGDPAVLEILRRKLDGKLGPDAQLEPVTELAPGERREPVVIALIVALGGPALVSEIVDIVRRVLDQRDEKLQAELVAEQQRLDHEYRMRELEMCHGLALRIVSDDDSETEVALDELLDKYRDLTKCSGN